MSAGHSRGRAWAPLWQWAVWSPARFVIVVVVGVLAVVGAASLTGGGDPNTPTAAGATPTTGAPTPTGSAGPDATGVGSPPESPGAEEPSGAAEGEATSPGSGIALNWVRDWCRRAATEPWRIYAARVAQLTAPSYATTLLATDGELFTELAEAAAEEIVVACSVSTPTLQDATADGGVFLVEYETVSSRPDVDSTVLSQGVVVTVAQVGGDLLVVDAAQGA